MKKATPTATPVIRPCCSRRTSNLKINNRCPEIRNTNNNAAIRGSTQPERPVRSVMLVSLMVKKDAGKGSSSSTPTKITVKKSTRLDRTSSTTPGETSETPKKWFSKSSKPPAKSQISQISSSTPSLISGTKRQQTESAKKKPRPASSVISSTNVTLRRGQQQSSKGEHQSQQQGEDLSRASSATNLNAEVTSRGGQSAAKGAKPRKAESRDRIDKIAVGGGAAGHQGSDGGKNKKVAANKNNNKEQNEVFNHHVHQQQQQQQQHHHQNNELLVDVEILQRQLAQMANEKSSLALQLGEQTGQLNSLQGEVVKLKMLQEQSNHQLEQLVEENSLLRNRLKDVSHSPLSDNEKQQLLFESHRHHSSAPASIATNVLDDGGDMTACPTPEWDKHSSGNVSEISVACLQDKINQMQETHYSTNEELQATLQELTDLQRQLTELQQENERLIEEKNLMFESLCRQTERLNDSRNEVEALKQLLYKDDMIETAAEREQKLVDLLKSAQDEREVLLVKQEQLGSDLEDSRSANLIHSDEILQLSERVKTLESTLDAKHAEHKLLDQELAQAKDQSSGRQIEINRLKDLLENARTKILEMEQDRTLSDKSELDELLDNARKEKDMLESEVAHLKEQLALSKNETEKLKEQVSVLQEECKVTRNNAKTTQSDLEYKCDKLAGEKAALAEQLQNFQEAVQELQVQAQCHADDKRQLSAVLSETQRNLNESERRIMALENELGDVKRLRQEQEEEWEKFQNDLLTSVRVANDFKTEAQQDLQKLIMENKAERERVRQLEAQIDKLKVTSTEIRPTSFDDLTCRRQKAVLSRQNSRQSVKSLIESLEHQAGNGKSLKGGGTGMMCQNVVSRSSSASSVCSMASSDLRTPSSPVAATPGSPQRTPLMDWGGGGDSIIKTPLKEQQPNKMWSKAVITDTISKSDLIKNKPDDNYRESILQKGIEFSRRNSYSDLSERKDPLNGLVKNGGSKRNALLKWCQNKTVGYRNIDITNFSSSWNDGLALCALLHTYLPDRVPYDSLTCQEKKRNFSLAFSAAESVGIPTTLNITDMIQLERPDWQQVMSYVTAIYKHFET